MTTDSIALIARGKTVCQDYVIHGSNYVIVCDGCSSSPNSQIGAMLLALSTQKFVSLYNQLDYSSFGEVVINDARNSILAYGLPIETLDATLVIAVGNPVIPRIRMYGDGVIWTEEDIYQYEYLTEDGKSMPLYLRYWIDKEAMQAWQELVDKFKENDKELAKSSIVDLTISSNYIGVGTDGLTALSNQHAKNVPLGQVIERFSEFKHTHGSFLARRLWATLKREKWIPADDIGIGIMLCK